MAVDAKGTDYLLIQTRAPLDAAQKAELAKLNVKLLEYVPESTYIANYVPEDLAKNRFKLCVMGEYVHARVKSPPRSECQGGFDQGEPDQRRRPSSLSGHQPRLVDVVLQNDVEPSKVLVPIATAAHLDPNTLVAGTHKFRISVQQRYSRTSRQWTRSGISRTWSH